MGKASTNAGHGKRPRKESNEEMPNSTQRPLQEEFQSEIPFQHRPRLPTPNSSTPINQHPARFHPPNEDRRQVPNLALDRGPNGRPQRHAFDYRPGGHVQGESHFAVDASRAQDTTLPSLHGQQYLRASEIPDGINEQSTCTPYTPPPSEPHHCARGEPKCDPRCPGLPEPRPPKTSENKKFTKEDDELMFFLKHEMQFSWLHQIYKWFPGRDHNTLQVHYCKMMKRSTDRDWTAEADRKLLKSVEDCTNAAWQKVGRILQRPAESCRMRWQALQDDPNAEKEEEVQNGPKKEDDSTSADNDTKMESVG